MDNPKEAAYDEHIAPLMTQIIELCKEHKINMAAQFSLDPRPDDDHTFCTTMVRPDEADTVGQERLDQLQKIMVPRHRAFAMIITTKPAEPPKEG